MTNLTKHQAKALDYNKHISLTANAGSGKTFVLSKRYLKIALEENVLLSNIAAITFTDKAAGELYKKIASQISERLMECNNASEKRKLENIRRQLVSANISTIHSFCIDILREHPVEAGLDANFSAIDEQTSGELIELSVDEMIKASLKNPDDVRNIKYLIRIFASKSLLAKEIIDLINNRKTVINLAQNIYSKSVTDTAEYFHDNFVQNIEKIFSGRIEKFILAVKDINNMVLINKADNKIASEVDSIVNNYYRQNGTEDSLKCLLAIKNLILTKEGKIKSKEFLAPGLREDLEKQIYLIEEVCDDLSYLRLPEKSKEIEIELSNFGNILIHYFKIALDIYSKKKSENGYLDYEDILLLTKNIIELNEVREHISNKFKYIMIDEYQDTNELQYRIFLPVLDQLKKGNLFVVGDEKQSIYMFRDAELEVFNLTKKNISDASGLEALLTLPDSFRMSPAICLFTNILFENLFEYPDSLYNEVEHSDLVCARKDKLFGGVEILLSGNNDEPGKENITNPEAETIARRVINLINNDQIQEKINWNDIAILCRKRKSFFELEKAFVKYKIPFLIVGGKGFFQRQTIYDIYNYFSFLSDEKNDTTLVGILRSPFFSISDSLIFEISFLSGKNYWEKLQKFGLINGQIENIVKRLKENLSYSKNYDVIFLLRKIFNDSDMLAVIASKPNGVQELFNIEKLVKISIQFFSQGFKTLYDYVNYLRESIELSEDESQAVVNEEINSVRIMTLHQAKGLEFPVVILYKCDEDNRISKVKSKTVTISKNFGLLTKVPLAENYSGEYQSAPIIGVSDLISKKKELAEIKRLFYVGVTRAKNYLIISGNVKQDYDYPLSSFLGLMQKGLDFDFYSDGMSINSDLQFLDPESNNYYTKKLNLDIPIVKDVEPVKERESDVQIAEDKKFIVGNINDTVKGEIISATKLSVYKQCPLKYHLTYNLGYDLLNNQFKKRRIEKKDTTLYEFNENEDENLKGEEEKTLRDHYKEFGVIKGRIIHKILQDEVSFAELNRVVNNLLDIQQELFEAVEKIKNELMIEIINDLKAFYNSDQYKELMEFKYHENEFEIYAMVNDYYLFGIIDRLIFEHDKVIIIDYKTDEATESELKEKVKIYFKQLDFYSYVLSKFYNNNIKFELRLVFIKYPEKVFMKEASYNDFEKIELDIEEMVKKLREKSGYGMPSHFNKNLDHCKSCAYSPDHHNCVVK